MRFGIAFALVLVIALFCFGAATAFIAHVFNNHGALGPPLLTLGDKVFYSPLAIFDWTKHFADDFPKPFAVARLIVFCGFILPPMVLARMLRKRPEPKPFGLEAWSKFEDAKAAGLYAATGTPLGKFDDEILCYDGPGHQLLIGASRSGKGRGHVVPTLLAWPDSALVLDVKGELADGDTRHGFLGTAGFRETLGPVLRFAPTKRDTCRFNPLMEVRRDHNDVRDVQNIVEIIADPAGDGRHNDFWDKAAKQVLTGVILHVLYAEPLERKSLAVVREKLRNLKATCDEMSRTLHRFNDKTGEPETHPEVLQGSLSFLDHEERLQSGLKATAESFFGVFADPIVAETTSASNFRISDLMCNDKPVTLFLQPPPSDAARLMPLMRLILNQISRGLMESQEKGNDGREKTHRLLLCLDEFPQLGNMPFFETHMSAMAGYGIKAYLVCQSLNHILRAYGRVNVILDNCHITTAFAAADMDTAKKISEMTGEVYEKRASYSEQAPSSFLGPKKGTISWRDERRPLMLPGDVRQLSRDEQLIFVLGTKPLKTKKLRFDTELVFVNRMRPSSKKRITLTPSHDWTDVQGIDVLPPERKPQARPSSLSRPAPPKSSPHASGPQHAPQADLFSEVPETEATEPSQEKSISQRASEGLVPPPGHPATQQYEAGAAATRPPRNARPTGV